ncbi:MAG: nucleotide exchange factor GrpE, partial [Oscillospiraceae bacterium]|nr:nucleotide exchange factor GrpE [Oscillospiraceae bacterium]
MSEETKQPAGEELPDTEEPKTEPEAPAAETAEPEKKEKKKKEKEKGFTFTREQVEQMELAAKQLESVKDQYVRLTAEYDNY